MLKERSGAHQREHALLMEMLNYRLESMDELRAQITAERGNFVTSDRYATLLQTVEAIQVDLARAIALADQTDKSSSVKRESLNKRLESMNEFRSAMKDQAASYVTRMESELNIKAVHGSFAAVEARLKRLEERAANMDGRFWGFGAIFGCVFTILNVVLSWWLANGHPIH
jgi:hypothetical protein